VSTLVSYTKSANDEATEGAIYAMPSTPLQARLWKLNETAPDPGWNVAVRFRLFGALNRETFERALQLLTTRHEALRTSFAVHDGAVIERIAAHVMLPWECCDLRSLEPVAQAEEVARLSLEHARQILPLTAAPLFRVGMLQLSDTEHILVWNAHHSICDGWSVGLLATDLMACYGELLQGREPAARTALDYGDYAVWLDAQRKTPEYEAHRAYWKQQLQGLEVSPLPDGWRASTKATEGSTIQSVLLPRSLTDPISAVAQRHHSTFFHAVLAAFGLLLRTQQSKSDVALETPMSGRDQSELESVVGTFVNYLPLRFRVDADVRFSGLLHGVRDLVTDCFEHAQFRYEDMLTDLENEGNRAVADTLPTPVAFICQQDFVRPITAGGVDLTAVPSVSPGALRPLTVFMVERADGWRLSCEVDNQVVSQAAGSRLLEDFQRLLQVIAAGEEDSTAKIAGRAGLTPITTRTENARLAIETAKPSLRAPMRIQATEFQRRFWRLDSLNPGGVAFHVRIRLQLKGRLDVDALERALASVALRNEILRTTLEEENDQVWQVIHPELPIDFRLLVSNVQGQDELRSDGQRLADQAIVDREGQEGFSLANGPLFRVRVLRLEDDRHWLAITLSHGIVDGWATGIFLEQLQQAYEQEVGSGGAGNASAVQFSVYAETERKLLGSPEKDRRLAWWQSYLGGVWTPLELPKDIDTSQTDAGDAPAGLVIEQLDPETAAAAKRFARECQATAFAVFGGLFQALLSRYSGQSDILFLTPHANRTGNTEAILGPLADPICLTGHVGAGTTFRELVTRFGAESMDAMEQALPLNLVTPLIDMRVGRNYHPLNQITFFYQRAFVHDMRWKDLDIESLPDVPTVTGSEWQLGVVERKNGVFLEFLYDATLYSEATIQIVQRHFARLLREAVMAPDTAVSKLKLMTVEEMEKYSTATPVLPVIERLLPRRQTIPPPVSAPMEREKIVTATKAPVSQSERDMIRIWRQILKLDEVDANSNFFDLGGHSLLLTKMQRILKRDYGVQLTAAEVFRRPTLGALAAWFEEARAAAKLAAKLAAEQSSRPAELDPRIIPLQPEGTGRPIFVISQSMIFRTLAAEMGSSQPVYALQMLDEEITSAAASFSYDDLISFYVRLIREVQPSGPYRLSGWCVSGWIAYGVARRLEEEGEEIELLMIIDVWAPGYWHYQPKIRRKLMMTVYKLKRLRTLLLRMTQSDMSEPDSLPDRKGSQWLLVARNIKTWLRERKSPNQTPLEQEMQRRGEMLETTATLARWAGVLHGTILLFRSGEEPTGPLLAPEMGWPEMLGRPAHVEVIPGGHREIFNLPGARMIAARARGLLGLDTAVDNESDIPEMAAKAADKLRGSGPQGER
jgi:thioesterase domain-containing protein/non-ribosomal peptide synthetase component F/NRPS condensation-like uncharacterized protein